MIYLDYQATTPIAPEVRGAMSPWVAEKFANPHSPHKQGREAAAMVEVARDSVAALMPPGGKVYFTSGATEALNWALRCAGTGGIAFRRYRTCRGSRYRALAWQAAPQNQHACRSAMTGWLTERPKSQLPNRAWSRRCSSITRSARSSRSPNWRSERMRQARCSCAMRCRASAGFRIPEGPDLIAVSAHKIHGPKGHRGAVGEGRR